MPKNTIFSTGGCYNPKRDGDLEKYLQTHDGRATFSLFHGIKWFYTLRDSGLFLPDYSVVRLMWNLGRHDEHFWVTEDYKLQGAQAAAHSGREGVHDPESILIDDNLPWEANNLALTDYMKKSASEFLAAYKKRTKSQ